MAAASPSGTPPPFWPLVEQSFEEAEFLWGRWEAGLDAHERDLEGLSFWVEERLLGSLEGVRVAGQAGIEQLLAPELTGGDARRAVVAAHVLATEPSPVAFDVLCDAIRRVTTETLPGLRRAIELSHSDLLLTRIERTVPPATPAQLALLLGAHAFQHRACSWVDQAMASGDAAARAAALTALRFDAAPTASRVTVASLAASSAAEADAAMETGLVHGQPEAWAYCQSAARGSTPAPRARLLVGLLAKDQRRRMLLDALGHDETRREAIFALGFAGTRWAAEAFCAISGLDLEREGLIALLAEESAPITFEDDDLDADLVPTPDDVLPLPDVDGVATWWARHADSFGAEQRYLRGRPLDLQGLCDALKTEPMRRRHALALELEIRTGGACRLQTRTFTGEQRRGWSRLESCSSPGVRSPLASVLSPLT